LDWAEQVFIRKQRRTDQGGVDARTTDMFGFVGAVASQPESTRVNRSRVLSSELAAGETLNAFL
jgi:hypothetical protein